MFGWFRKASKNLRPESRWSVSLTEGQIVVTGPDGNASQVAEMDLSGIVIETNDSGPWGADVWWLLFGVDDLMACAYPQGATGDADLLTYLTELPGFDHGVMIAAMASTENAVFPVWRR